MGRNNPPKSLPNRKDLPTTTKTRIPRKRTKNTQPKATKMERTPNCSPELDKRLENKPTHPKTIQNTLPAQNIRQSPQVHTRTNKPNKPALHQHHMRKAPNMTRRTKVNCEICHSFLHTTKQHPLLKCACHKCKRTPNPRNYISIQGKATYFYCDNCWPHIRDYFAHTFIKGPMEV